MQHIFAFRKLSFLLLAIIFLGTSFASAQDFERKQDTLRRTKVGTRLEVPKDAGGRKRLERDHYRRTLGVDSVKAEQVLKVQAEYKSGVALIVADTSLNDAGKRVAIDRLIRLKNRQLEGLLTPAQQSRVIPTTERNSGSKAQ